MSANPFKPSSRGRSLARRLALQALYQWQLGGEDPRHIMNEFMLEREMQKVDLNYFTALMLGVSEHVTQLNEDLAPVLDRPLKQLDPVERAILWIGTYELRHMPDVPRRVVINEGVELTKAFGAEQAFKYVNATLDRLSRTLRPES